MTGRSDRDRPGAGAGRGTIYVDADACPVKEEVYKVAERHGVAVAVVANSFVRHGAGS